MCYKTWTYPRHPEQVVWQRQRPMDDLMTVIILVANIASRRAHGPACVLRNAKMAANAFNAFLLPD